MSSKASSESGNVEKAVEALMDRVAELSPDFHRIIDPKSLETRAAHFGQGKFDR